LIAQEALDAAPPYSRISSIESEPCRRACDFEEKSLQLERDVGLQQQEASDLRESDSGFTAENRAQKQGADASHKRSDELVAQFSQMQWRSEDAIKRIMQKLRALRHQNHAPPRQKQFPSNNRGETPAVGGIWQQMAKSGEANKRVLQESLQRQNSAATVVIRKFLGLRSVRSMRSARNAAVFFRSVAKDLEATKQKSSGYLTGGGSQPRKADFTGCSGVFRLWGGSLTSEDSLEVAIPGKHVFTPDSTHCIHVDFARDCQGSVETFLCIKRLIEARYSGAAVGIHLDIGSGSVAIPTNSNQRLVFYSSAESLRIPD
jgi:hypothetical protein